MAKGTCCVEGCEKPSHARSLCPMHYQRWRGGDIGVAAHKRAPAARHVRGPWGGCWEWTGSKSAFGYGMRRAGPSETGYVHRLVFEAIFGPIPDGLCVLHRCDNPPCFRPDHLFLGTHADNNADAAAKGRTARGTRRSARLTESDVRAIRSRQRSGEEQQTLAHAFGVGEATVSNIVRRRTWAWLE